MSHSYNNERRDRRGIHTKLLCIVGENILTIIIIIQMHHYLWIIQVETVKAAFYSVAKLKSLARYP